MKQAQIQPAWLTHYPLALRDFCSHENCKKQVISSSLMHLTTCPDTVSICSVQSPFGRINQYFLAPFLFLHFNDWFHFVDAESRRSDLTNFPLEFQTFLKGSKWEWHVAFRGCHTERQMFLLCHKCSRVKFIFPCFKSTSCHDLQHNEVSLLRHKYWSLTSISSQGTGSWEAVWCYCLNYSLIQKMIYLCSLGKIGPFPFWFRLCWGQVYISVQASGEAVIHRFGWEMINGLHL